MKELTKVIPFKIEELDGVTGKFSVYTDQEDGIETTVLGFLESHGPMWVVSVTRKEVGYTPKQPPKETPEYDLPSNETPRCEGCNSCDTGCGRTIKPRSRSRNAKGR